MKDSTKHNVTVILAAGGNPTGIVSFPDAGMRGEYSSIARGFMAEHPEVEQFGFLEGIDHFQMSGGEFCGNAARAAALLISKMTGHDSGAFTMSGFNGTVSYGILGDGQVECQFPGLQIKQDEVEVLDDVKAKLVDLGGIVHVVLPPDYPFDDNPDVYRETHRSITESLGLGDKPAVGVVWRDEKADGSVTTHPVVWVRDIDSFFYETACGSGTLAVLEVSGKDFQEIVQPSGQSILAWKRGGTYILRSRMEIV